MKLEVSEVTTAEGTFVRTRLVAFGADLAIPSMTKVKPREGESFEEAKRRTIAAARNSRVRGPARHS